MGNIFNRQLRLRQAIYLNRSYQIRPSLIESKVTGTHSTEGSSVAENWRLLYSIPLPSADRWQRCDFHISMRLLHHIASIGTWDR
jgi:hypothetical protein